MTSLSILSSCRQFWQQIWKGQDRRPLSLTTSPKYPILGSRVDAARTAESARRIFPTDGRESGAAIHPRRVATRHVTLVNVINAQIKTLQSSSQTRRRRIALGFQPPRAAFRPHLVLQQFLQWLWIHWFYEIFDETRIARLRPVLLAAIAADCHDSGIACFIQHA